MRTRSSARTETRPPKSDDDVDMPAPSPAPREPAPIKRRKKSKWDASTVLTNDRSPLAKCDLRVRYNDFLPISLADAVGV